MKIKVSALCYNEEKMLPFFLNHYGAFCDKIVIFDNYSTDKSVEIIKAHPKAELRYYSTQNKVDDDMYIRLKNIIHRADYQNYDWQIVVDIDEFLYHPNIRECLSQYSKQGITLPKVKGYQMVSSEFPTTSEKQIYEQVDKGVYSSDYSKLVVYNPQKISNMRYTIGCHSCKPQGSVIQSATTQLKLLHYKFISYRFVIERYKLYKHRLSNQNITKKWGRQYLHSLHTIEADFQNLLKNAKKVV